MIARMNRVSQFFALSIALTGVVAFATQSWAQTSNTSIPRQANPGLLSPKDSTLPSENQQEKRNLLPNIDNGGDVKIDVPEMPTAQRLQSPKFLVQDIVVNGVTLFQTAEIDQVVAGFKGKELSLDELGGLVDELNKLYRGKGYLTTQAYIPPQDIENGKVTIEVLEGKIGSMSVSGNKYTKAWAVERVLEQDPGDVLNIKQLEDNLNSINQRENFRLKAVLSPGEHTGETDVKLEVAERQPWQIAATFDNQGRPFIGYYRYGVEVTNQNLTGIGDRLYARWIGARGNGTNVALAGYALPLNRYGTELSYNFAYSHVNVDLGIPNQQEITGSAQNHSILLSHPLDKKRYWTADAGVNFRNVLSKLDGATTNSTFVFSMQSGLSFDRPDRYGRTFLRGQFTYSPNQDFSKWELFGTRLTRLPFNHMLITRANAQISPNDMPPVEQFQLGGAFSVRGYSEGLLVGDRGFNIGIEDRFPIPFMDKVSPWVNERVQLAAFFDYGSAWLDRSNPSYIGGTSSSGLRTQLMGGGLGVRARLTQYAQGFCDFGWGFFNRASVEPYGQPSVRVHFGIRSELLPTTVSYRDTGVTPIKGSKVKAADNTEAAPAEEATPTGNAFPSQPEVAPATSNNWDANTTTMDAASAQ